MLPYDEAGSGPPVVLLHAGIADRSMWREHLEPLAAAGHRVVALDFAGFGEAPLREGRRAPWNDVLDTMDSLNIGRAVLVGNSFGAAVALRVAAVAPARVSALALISAPAPDTDAEPSPQLRAAWEQEEAALERGDIDTAVEAVLAAWTLPDAPAQLREQVAAMARTAFQRQHGQTPATEAEDPLEADPDLLTRLEIPTLVAAGEHDMVDFGAGALTLAGLIPGARHTVIAAAGHLAPLETPRAVCELLIGFLATVPG
jgi:pimeloyl-ACP methyl ester carboxylesterase